jgi:hypothetical protein
MRWLICFLAVMRDVLVSVDAFSLHNFRARNIYPDEVSCFFVFFKGGGALLRALRVRVGACLAVVQCLDEMTRFLAAECSC